LGKLLIILGISPFQHELVGHCFRLARAAVEEGHNCTLFLFMDGVYNLLNTQNGDVFKVKTTNDEIDELMKLGVKVICCKLCSELRGVVGQLKSQEVQAKGLGELNDELMDADALLSFLG
jgi:sulfur relay (sulfurtransferase) complex TusBCD TusD component (DsrE family)